MIKRLNPDDRRIQLLEAAIAVASKGHYKHITRKEIAEAAGTSGPLVRHYLGTMADLPDILMEYAVANTHLWVIAQGLIDQNPIAWEAPQILRKKARGVLSW